MKKTRRQLKGLLYRIQIHRVIPTNLFYYISHLSKASKWINEHKNISFSSFPTTKIEYKKRILLYDHVINSENLENIKLNYLEFGVHEGTSFNWWSERLINEECRFYGFDTFSGLPEDWGPFKKGHFGGIDVPEHHDSRSTFLQGLFQQTLIPFLKDFDNNGRKIIHLDADLYSSTLYVLTILTPYIKSGDIILFDEFNVPIHEIKAFMEWTESFYISYEVLGEVNNFFQVAIKIK